MAVGRRRTVVARAAAALAVALALTGCGDDPAGDAGRDDGPEADAPSPDAPASLVAQATGDQVQVYATAGGAEPTTALANPNENGGPLVFLVDEEQGDWLRVLLPVRPNGSTGWIRKAEVEVARNPYRIDVALAAHTLTVHEGDELVSTHPIGVGTAATPTPGGRYYIKELLEPSDPGGPYGPYAYGLSGFSNVLETFNGGDGVIGIHGTNDPASVGTDVSHGCIRLTNDAITDLVAVLPLGTPVHIAP